jgi:DNA-binding beta-propeller fold protein YncE
MKRLLAALLALAAGCAHAPRKEVFWPPPPDKARIRFVTAFAQTEDLGGGSRWDDVRRQLLGASQDPALSSPSGVAVSDDGQRVYVADYGSGLLFRADLAARSMSPLGADELRGRPFAVALDESENVYVTESLGAPAVAVLSRDGVLLKRFGSGEALERPTGIAIDRNRHLVYVVDSGSQVSSNHRVLVYDTSGKYLRRLGPAGLPPRGDGDGQFNFPDHIAVRSDGQVYVADAMNFRIQVFDPAGRFVRKFGQSGDGVGTFARIKGLAFDSFDNLYEGEGERGVVQIFNSKDEPLLFFGGFAPNLLEYFDVPGGIAIHAPTNRIFVCNQHGARINVYELINTSAEDSR